MTKKDPDISFTLQAGALRPALTMLAAVIERRNTIPVLAHAVLEARDGILSMRATDAEASIACTLPGDGDLPGLTLAPASLAALLRHVPGEEAVTLRHLPDGAASIATRSMSARMFSFPANDAPAAPAWGYETRVPIKAEALIRLLDRPRHAISTEETRYYLNGVYLHPVEADARPMLRGVATDGHRLFIAEEPAPEGWCLPGMIVPRKAVRVLLPLLRMLPKEAAVEVRGTGAMVEIAARGWVFGTKLIDGTFPDYPRVFPKAAGTPLLIHSGKEFARVVSQVSGISAGRSRPVVLGNGAGSALTVKASSVEIGEARATLPGDVAGWGSNAEHPEFGVQARYLLDVCRTFPGEFRMEVVDERSPIRIAGPEGTALLMPMRV